MALLTPKGKSNREHKHYLTSRAIVRLLDQWQPPAVGGFGPAWTNEANFEDPIGILAARKRLPHRCAV